MADFLNQNETPYYELLTAGKTETQKNPILYQSSNEVNQQTYNYGGNAIYRSPFNCNNCFFIVIFFFAGSFGTIMMISVGISENRIEFILLSLFPLIFLIIAFIVGSTNNIYVVINISSTLGTIAITKKRLCCCFTKKEIVQINDVQQVIAQTEFSSFNVIFKLYDGREVYGCSKIDNKNGEGRKAFEIIRKVLPERISFSGNLVK